jgi:hypothetical protein
VQIYFKVTVPDELVAAFMQAVRDIDTRFDPDHESRVHIESLAESDWPVEKMEKVYRALTPEFRHVIVKKFDDGTPND